jgi:L-amino acid N-acyltransferase YncA
MSNWIRSATRRDAPAILSIYAPAVLTTAASFELDPPDEPEMQARIATTLESFPWLVLEDGGRVAAYAYAGRFHARPAYRWSVEVSVYVDANHRGRGAGKALLRSLLRELDRCGFVNAFAGVTLPNPSSVRLFEGLGFEQVAHYRDVGFKLGAWRDVGWWQKRLRDPPGSPSEPISWRSLRVTERLRRTPSAPT